MKRLVQNADESGAKVVFTARHFFRVTADSS
jgi:hypothetical protein